MKSRSGGDCQPCATISGVADAETFFFFFNFFFPAFFCWLLVIFKARAEISVSRGRFSPVPILRSVGDSTLLTQYHAVRDACIFMIVHPS